MSEDTEKTASEANLKSKLVDEARGYRIDIKLVVLAFAIEAVLITCGLIVAWIQAKQNAHAETIDYLSKGLDSLSAENFETNRFILAFIGAIGFAMVELTRVPLALLIRIHSSKLIQIISIVGVIAAAGLTFKTMSQAADAMYSYRNLDVSLAKNQLDQAISKLKADYAILDNKNEVIKNAERNRDEISKQISAAQEVAKQAAGKTTCKTQYITADDGTQIPTEQNCREVSSVNVANQQVKEYNKNLKDAKDKLDSLNLEKTNFINTVIQKSQDEVNLKDHSLKEKKIASQLYSLAASLLRKDKMQLTDEDIEITLQYLTYLPALLVAFASTLIAIGSVTRIKQSAPQTIMLPDEIGEFILGPFSQTIKSEIERNIRTSIEMKKDEN